MILLKQMIEKKFSLYEEFKDKGHLLKAYWNLRRCLNMALSIIFIYEKVRILNKIDIKKRTLAFGQFSSQVSLSPDSIERLEKFTQEDIAIIIRAISLIEKNQDNSSFKGEMIYPPYVIGVPSYLLPD